MANGPKSQPAPTDRKKESAGVPPFDPKAFLATAGVGRKVLKHAKKDIIFAQGDDADAVFYITKGKVKVTVLSTEGKEAIVALLGPNEFVGEGCLIGQPKRLATASAITECETMRVEKRELQRVLHDELAFSEVFVSHILARNALKQTGCRRIFEEARSGADRERPKLRETIDFLQPGDTLIVWKLDRLARSLSHLIELVEQLQKMSCGLRSLTEAIDTTTSGGRLVFHVFGALAEFERGIIRERTLAGLASARARGRKGGRPKSLDQQKITVAEALLRDGLLTVKEVARQLGVSEATLYKYIPAPRSLVGKSKLM